MAYIRYDKKSDEININDFELVKFRKILLKERHSNNRIISSIESLINKLNNMEYNTYEGNTIKFNIFEDFTYTKKTISYKINRSYVPLLNDNVKGKTFKEDGKEALVCELNLKTLFLYQGVYLKNLYRLLSTFNYKGFARFKECDLFKRMGLNKPLKSESRKEVVKALNKIDKTKIILNKEDNIFHLTYTFKWKKNTL